MIRPILEIVPKAWGKEVVIANNDKYCGKLLIFDARTSGSLHYHKIKHETFYLNKGVAKIQIRHDTHMLASGDCVELPPNTPHRIYALTYCEFIEFSTPHRDDDTYRITPSQANADPDPA